MPPTFIIINLTLKSKEKSLKENCKNDIFGAQVTRSWECLLATVWNEPVVLCASANKMHGKSMLSVS